MPAEQLDFDFNSPAEDGYETWMWNRQQASERIARKYKLPIGRNVRLKRYNIDGEFTGKLELPRIPVTINPKNPIDLKLGNMIFPSSEIEYCIAVES